MKTKKIMFTVSCCMSSVVILVSCATSVPPADRAPAVNAASEKKNVENNLVLLDNPEDMNVTMKGDPEKAWNVLKSEIVPAKPNTWYRASTEIRTALQPGAGSLSFRVRQIGADEKSLVYADIAVLKPSLLNYSIYSDVFLTRPETVKLQVCYQLSRVDGTASFRNLKLEEISEEEAEKIRAAYQVPPAYFAPPVYAYEGEKELPWGYRVSADLLKKDQIPSKIALCLPDLSIKTSETARVNEFASSRIQLPYPLKKGKYTVQMTALDAEGKELAREERFLRVIDHPRTAARLPVKSVEIDSSGNTVINGKPVLLNGLYHVYTEPQIREVAEAGFNTVIAWAPTPEKYLTMLNRISKCGLYSDCVIKRLFRLCD